MFFPSKLFHFLVKFNVLLKTLGIYEIINTLKKNKNKKEKN